MAQIDTIMIQLLNNLKTKGISWDGRELREAEYPLYEQTLLKVLKKNTVVESFSLYHWYLTEKGGDLLVRHLLVKTTLRHANFGGIKFPKLFYKLLFLLKHSSLESLIFSGMPIELEDMKRIKHLLPKCEKLQGFALNNCELTADHIKHLAAGVSKSRVKRLLLSGNAFGDKGIRFLKNALTKPTIQIEYLMLSGCNITDKGAKTLATVLEYNTSISSLILCAACVTHPNGGALNRIGDAGVMLISRALLQNVTLKSLILDQLPLTGKGIINAMEVLLQDTWLGQVSFYECLDKTRVVVSKIEAGLVTVDGKVEVGFGTVDGNDDCCICETEQSCCIPRPTTQEDCWKQVSNLLTKRKNTRLRVNPFFDGLNGTSPLNQLHAAIQQKAVQSTEWNKTLELNAFRRIRQHSNTISAVTSKNEREYTARQEKIEEERADQASLLRDRREQVLLTSFRLFLDQKYLVVNDRDRYNAVRLIGEYLDANTEFVKEKFEQVHLEHLEKVLIPEFD